MRFDLMTGGLSLARMQQLGRDASAAGFSGLVVTEAGRTAYLACGAVAVTGVDLDLLTGIAVAFPRSPMVTAQVAWELAEATGGRFRLGLGTQVRAHIVRRYGVDFEPPGPRMRDYLLALRDIFAAFRGGTLDHHSAHWDLTLLPAAWSPGTLDGPDPPIDLAAVNPWMLRLAGEMADGVHVHPLNTPTYLGETVVPNLEQGASRAGRERGDLEVIVPTFAAPGSNADEVEAWRALARTQIAFYGSTPNYAFVFEQLGREGTTERIRERQKAGDLTGMAAQIDDELLDHFCISGDWATVADGLVERYTGTATRLVSYFAGTAWARDAGALGPWGELARAVRAAAG